MNVISLVLLCGLCVLFQCFSCYPNSYVVVVVYMCVFFSSSFLLLLLLFFFCYPLGHVTVLAGFNYTTTTGSGHYLDGTGTQAGFYQLTDVEVNPVTGIVYVVDSGNSVIRTIDQAGIIS